MKNGILQWRDITFICEWISSKKTKLTVGELESCRQTYTLVVKLVRNLNNFYLSIVVILLYLSKLTVGKSYRQTYTLVLKLVRNNNIFFFLSIIIILLYLSKVSFGHATSNCNKETKLVYFIQWKHTVLFQNHTHLPLIRQIKF